MIVVDDGSTDDSRELLERLRGPGRGRAEGERRAGLGAQRRLRALPRRRRHLPRRRRPARTPRRRRAVAAAFAADAGRGEGAVPDGGDRRRRAARPAAIKPPPHLPMPSGDVRAGRARLPFDLTWLPTSANAFRREALRADAADPGARLPDLRRLVPGPPDRRCSARSPRSRRSAPPTASTAPTATNRRRRSSTSSTSAHGRVRRGDRQRAGTARRRAGAAAARPDPLRLGPRQPADLAASSTRERHPIRDR